ncbi:MAG: 7-cyano-7-deazaguanine synthase QueC [Candidatus Ratteibacteria bacterium]|nr:7-cyano-7-deazaguanine synthase QueC [Candidatus Ratteibacteria bacterium]
MKKAVVLLSGGLDSATTLYLAKKASYRCLSLIFDYGQRHKKEIAGARKISGRADSPFTVIRITLPWAQDALINKKKPIPGRKLKNPSVYIPSTYVTGRNTIFLSFAVSYAESVKAQAVFIGANALDWSGYPDCTPDYFKTWEKLIKAGTKAGRQGKKIEIKVPLLNKTKAEIARLGENLGVPFELTWSCYKGGKNPCRRCDACQLRARGFNEAGLMDPLVNRNAV